jgi:uncharacterized protein DUF6283
VAAAQRLKKPKPRAQCKHCPWKKSTNPHEIPNGYSVEKHRALTSTIAEPGELPRDDVNRVMACHESDLGKELPCVGWLVHQLGPGNNIALRLAVLYGRVDANVETVGPQHTCLEDTLPKEEDHGHG